MQESNDPAINLFGKKIALLSDGEITMIPGDELQSTMANEECSKEGEEEKQEDSSTVKITETAQQDDAPRPSIDESANPEELAVNNVNPKTNSIDDEIAKSKASKFEKSQNEASSSQEKTLKKPDKILQCPRCNSMDTKFCYYNNYNINQPRHFCKACQRYWTAGGTMRNVPVGAGRRKNKNSASHYHHISISEALQVARIDAPNGVSHPNLKSNGRALSFGFDAPICNSMTSVLNIAEKKVLNSTQNVVHGFQEQEIAVPCTGGENGDDCSSTSSITISNPMDEGSRNCTSEPLIRNANGFPSPVPCVPWPYPCNTAVCPPAFYPSWFPMSFYPAAFWNYGIPNTWNVPGYSPTPQSSPNNNGQSSGPDSPKLGKHSRETDMLKPDNMKKKEQPSSKEKNGCVLVPKPLRIDDPNEAAKSSIWATLGIKNETISGEGLFKELQQKSDQKSHMVATSPVLRANPAALSRSLNFHEST